MDDPKEGIKLGCQCAEFTFGAETTGRPGLYQPFDVFFWSGFAHIYVIVIPQQIKLGLLIIKLKQTSINFRNKITNLSQRLELLEMRSGFVVDVVITISVSLPNLKKVDTKWALI